MTIRYRTGIILIFALMVLAGCGDATTTISDAALTPKKVKEAPGAVGEVILYRDGQARTSYVKKIGSRCWVAWYVNIEKVLLNGDGTAVAGVFRYRWTLNRAGPDDAAADQEWFRQNCAEPLGENP